MLFTYRLWRVSMQYYTRIGEESIREVAKRSSGVFSEINNRDTLWDFISFFISVFRQ